jgi:hypothetical protein
VALAWATPRPLWSTVTTVKPDGPARKWAFAHYMSNQGTRSRDQSVENWQADIRDAMAYGIDGWQFNFAHYRDSYRTNIGRFVQALEKLGPEAAGFHFFPSFDCNKKRTPGPDEIQAWFADYYDHPNHFRLDGQPLLTAWQTRHVGNAHFAGIKESLAKTRQPVRFIPWIAVEPTPKALLKLFERWPAMDGFFPWVPGKSVPDAVALNAAAAAACRKHGKQLMAGQGFSMAHLNKAPVYRNKHAAEAVTAQMMPLVDGTLPDCRMLNVATWNDFGEDSHITPHTPYPPKGDRYPVWSHIGYATVLAYYLQWWKTETTPTIQRDTLVFFHLTQLAREGKSPYPYKAYRPDQAQDTVYVTTLLTAPATLRVQSGKQAPVEFAAPAGISHWRTPATAGAQKFALLRQGKEIVGKTSDRTIDSPPTGRWTWSQHSEAVTA